MFDVRYERYMDTMRGIAEEEWVYDQIEKEQARRAKIENEICDLIEEARDDGMTDEIRNRLEELAYEGDEVGADLEDYKEFMGSLN